MNDNTNTEVPVDPTVPAITGIRIIEGRDGSDEEKVVYVAEDTIDVPVDVTTH